MSFNIYPIREFVVRPALPGQLSRMPELAYNILWAWEPSIRTLFRRLDPGLWKDSVAQPGRRNSGLRSSAPLPNRSNWNSISWRVSVSTRT